MWAGVRMCKPVRAGAGATVLVSRGWSFTSGAISRLYGLLQPGLTGIAFPGSCDWPRQDRPAGDLGPGLCGAPRR